MKILKKQNKDGMIYFVLYEDKKMLLESDLFFDNDFLNKFDGALDLAMEQAGIYISDIYSDLKVNKNDFFGILVYFLVKNDENLKSRLLYFSIHFGVILLIEGDSKNKFNLKGINIFSLHDSKETLRIIGVLFHSLQFVNENLIYNGSSKLKSLYEDYKICESDIYIDNFYFRGIEKIDQVESDARLNLLRVKGFGDYDLINIYIKNIFNNDFIDFIKRKGIDAIGVIPNNIQRKVSLNQEISEYISQILPNIALINIYIQDFPERMPQKSTRGLCNRIKNADNLIQIDDISNQKYNNILIIDDVFGSGATMNSAAHKIHNQLPNSSIIGFAILSSYRKGFDVLSEV